MYRGSLILKVESANLFTFSVSPLAKLAVAPSHSHLEQLKSHLYSQDRTEDPREKILIGVKNVARSMEKF